MKKTLLFYFTFILTIPFALADIGSTIQNVWFKILGIGSLSFLGISDGSLVVAFTRILIWILIFAILFALTTSLGGTGGSLSFLKRNHAVVISFVIATIAAVFLPAQVLLATGAGWGTLVGLILIGSPIVAIAFLFWKLPNEPCPYLMLKFILSLLIFWILSAMRFHTGKMIVITNPVISTVQDFIDYAMGIIIIIAIYYFIRWLLCLFGHLSGGDGEFKIPKCIKRICDDFGKEREGYKRLLDELEELINQLEELFRQLKIIGQQILDFLEDNKERPYDSDRPEIPIDLLAQYNELLSQISNLKDKILLKITEISDLLSKLNHAERRRFSSLTSRFSILVADINAFIIKVRDAMRDYS